MIPKGIPTCSTQQTNIEMLPWENEPMTHIMTHTNMTHPIMSNDEKIIELSISLFFVFFNL